MSKLFSLCVAFALMMPTAGPGSRAQGDVLVDVSSRFIGVRAGGGAPATERITLAATLYQPRFLSSAPAVIYIHGWGGQRLSGSDNLAYYIAAAGYVVLSYTARGFGGGESGGRVSLAGPNEISDLKEIIDWLTSDPDDAIGPRVTKIGVVGGSYGGGHSFQISSDPRVSAAIPLIGWTNLEQSLFPNGVINYKQGLGHFYSGLERSTSAPPFYNYDRLQFEMFDAAAEGREVSDEIKQALAERSIAEPDQTGRLVLKPSRRPRVPTFIIQSWDDYLFPSTQVLDIYPQITAPKQIYLGRTGHPPGGHSFAGEELYIGTQVLRWFDHHLRGNGGVDSRSVSSLPAPLGEVPLVLSGVPSAMTEPLTLYLKPGGVLSRKKKGKTREERAAALFRPQRIRSTRLGAEIPSQSDMFSATVADVAPYPRRLAYTFGPLESQLEMIGSSEFSLYVGSATSDMVDIVARLYDVAPNGEETEVTVGVVRVKGLLSAQSQAAPVRVSFRDFGDHWVFRPGHSIRLKLANVDFPDFRPPGANDDRVSDLSIHTGKAYPSSFKLPVRK